MQSLFHLAASAEALLATITTAWAALGEIVTAGALLLALDRLAAAIRAAYRAGVIAGRILWPVIHIVIAGLRWLYRNIDWAEVRDTVIAGLKVLIAGVIALAITAHQLLVQLSAALGRAYVALVVREAGASRTPLAAPAVPATAPVEPLQHPLALVAAELEPLSHRQLQSITGCRRRVAKQQLIAAALAW